ncbi:hypothetical protein HC928_13100 [bacterium]|nr:hypothetical protein [bacterium]
MSAIESTSSKMLRESGDRAWVGVILHFLKLEGKSLPNPLSDGGDRPASGDRSRQNPLGSWVRSPFIAAARGWRGDRAYTDSMHEL